MFASVGTAFVAVAAAFAVWPGTPLLPCALTAAIAALAFASAFSSASHTGGTAPWGPLGDNMTAGLLLFDGADNCVYVNSAAERFLGLSRSGILGRKADEVPRPMRLPLLLAMDLLKHGRPPVVTGRFPLNSRMAVAEFSRGQSAANAYEGMAVLIRDMTESCEFCGHLIRAERMTVLGELAAAMAHEINSPLGGVMESLRIIRKNAGNWDKIDRFLPLVQRGLEQIETTVKQMLRFATPHEAPRTRLVLEEVIAQCIDFLSYRQSETGAELTADLDSGHTAVTASAHALGQVLLNLINNAFDAVAGRPGAFVGVRSALVPARGEVMVQVTDNGPGVPSHLRARIFEPFFTTRASGKGTGLGLSISARIAAGHGGRIIVSDREGGGAVFTLVLPLVGRSTEDADVRGR